MSQTVRFPLPFASIKGAVQTSQIITILPAKSSPLALGGEQAYVNVQAWKTAGDANSDAPYTCVVLEFSARVSGIVGNGTTDLIGLYGQIDLAVTPASASERKRTLLGIIGMNIGNSMPQIPLVQQVAAASDFVGFSQVFSNIAVYDRLSIGGVLADVPMADGLALTVVARPIRMRDYLA